MQRPSDRHSPREFYPDPGESRSLRARRAGRGLAALRALQVFGLSVATLTLGGLAVVNQPGGQASAVAAVPGSGQAPTFSVLIAGRDISYCYYRQPCKDQNQREGLIQAPNTDTLMLVKVSGADVRVLNIPRDTNVGDFDWNRGRAEQKVNSRYWEAGPQALVSAVETITGEHVDSYVVVRSDYVERVVDALGGLDVNVPQGGIEWVDQAAGVDLKLAAGDHHLGGRDAVLYLRVRKGFGDDYGRIDHQKQALAQLAGRLKTAQGLSALPVILGGVGNGVDTNADPNLLLGLRPYLSRLKLAFATLPTDPIEGTFNLAVNRERLARVWGAALTPDSVQQPVIVRVMDASGQGFGARLARALAALGYAEVDVSVSPASKEPSQVFTQQDVAQAGILADALNLPRLQGERFPVAAGEVGILLGTDALTHLAALEPLSPTPETP